MEENESPTIGRKKRSINAKSPSPQKNRKSPQKGILERTINLFLKEIYKYLSKSTGNKVDKFTIEELTHLPLIVTEKLVQAFNYNNKKEHYLTKELFVNGFITLYYGNLKDKVKLIFSICNFNGKNKITYNDIKILFLHLHFRLMTVKRLKKMTVILDNFFSEKESFTESEFIEESLNHNFDIVFIFLKFFEKFKFFTNDQINYYEIEILKIRKPRKSTTASESTKCPFTGSPSCFSQNTNKLIKSNNSKLVSSPVKASKFSKRPSRQIDQKDNNGFSYYYEHNSIPISAGKIYEEKETSNFSEDDNYEDETKKYNDYYEDAFKKKLNFTTINDKYMLANYVSNEELISEEAQEYFELIENAELYTTYFEENEQEELDSSDEEDLQMINACLSFDNDYNYLKTQLAALGEFLMSNETREEKIIEKANIKSNNYMSATNLNGALRKAKKEKIAKTFIGNDSHLGVHFGSFARKPSENCIDFMGSLFSNDSNKRFSYEGANIKYLDNKFEIECNLEHERTSEQIEIKLVILDNLIFLYEKSINDNRYIFSKFIVIAQIYASRILKFVNSVLVDDNNFLEVKNKTALNKSHDNIIIDKVPSSIIRKSSENITATYNQSIYQLVLTVTLHGVLTTFKLYSKSKGDFISLSEHIEKVLHLRCISEFYKAESEIGRGNFGRVIKAVQKSTGNIYSIKIIPKETIENSEEDFKCFQWEKDVFIFLSHVQDNNIVKCYDYFETPSEIYYIHEYIKGCNLKSLIINNRVNDNINLNPSFQDFLAREIIKGIATLHKYGIIHRDIKHENVLVSFPENKLPQIKIIDFGLSRVLGFNEKSHDNYGSLIFEAPEIIKKERYSFKVDVWALGITLYYLLTKGCYPFAGDSNESTKRNIVDKDYPIDNSEILFKKKNYATLILKKCLNKNFEERADIFELEKIRTGLNFV